VIKAVEHHHFKARGRWYLFDVNAFTVLRSDPLDRLLLCLANRDLTVEALVERAVSKGASPKGITERLALLVERRFLLPPGESPQQAVLRESHAQVTCMINVAQRCNLSCPYCYVNKGYFDYEEKPIGRMTSQTANRLVTGSMPFSQAFSATVITSMAASRSSTSA